MIRRPARRGQKKRHSQQQWHNQASPFILRYKLERKKEDESDRP